MIVTERHKRAVQALLLLAAVLSIVTLVGKLLWPFISSLAWAVLLALVTWPLHRRVTTATRVSATGAALITTALVSATFALAIVPLLLELTLEARAAVSTLETVEWITIEQWLGAIPLIGPTLVDALHVLKEKGLLNYAYSHREEMLTFIGHGAKAVGEGIITLLFAIFLTFFLYRDGRALAHQLQTFLVHIGGENSLRFIATATDTLRGAVYGTVLTALAQGLIAALGFWLFGAPTPVLFGFLTMLFSFIPFGAPMVYLPVAGYLLATEPNWHQGALLVLWGVSLVSTSDNILRPYFISQATQVSLVLVLLGIIGGVLQFGPIGLFLGPALLAVARSMWLTYLASITPAQSIPTPQA